MRPARRQHAVPSRKSSSDADAGSEVLNDEAVLAHLEAFPRYDDDGDPIRGIGNGAAIGAVLWAILIGIVVTFF
ncbi:MAG TPA: hypothetical protein VLD39_18720 [Gammaproteobacteria bacterium]|nr:hypothetical protein [Gammaproteobacteria bacterium]